MAICYSLTTQIGRRRALLAPYLVAGLFVIFATSASARLTHRDRDEPAFARGAYQSGQVNRMSTRFENLLPDAQTQDTPTKPFCNLLRAQSLVGASAEAANSATERMWHELRIFYSHHNLILVTGFLAKRGDIGDHQIQRTFRLPGEFFTRPPEFKTFKDAQFFKDMLKLLANHHVRPGRVTFVAPSGDATIDANAKMFKEALAETTELEINTVDREANFKSVVFAHSNGARIATQACLYFPGVCYGEARIAAITSLQGSFGGSYDALITAGVGSDNRTELDNKIIDAYAAHVEKHYSFGAALKQKIERLAVHLMGDMLRAVPEFAPAYAAKKLELWQKKFNLMSDKQQKSIRDKLICFVGGYTNSDRAREKTVERHPEDFAFYLNEFNKLVPTQNHIDPKIPDKCFDGTVRCKDQTWSECKNTKLLPKDLFEVGHIQSLKARSYDLKENEVCRQMIALTLLKSTMDQVQSNEKECPSCDVRIAKKVEPEI